MKMVDIYTDGACSGNPGPGGYGAVLRYGAHRRELSGGFLMTTNNRMEMLAAIIALETLKEACVVTLYSDSSYLVNAVSKGWLERWRAGNWMKQDKTRVANVDLWQRFLAAKARHALSMVWVKGHASNELNNRCDELARAAIAAGGLSVDHGFQPIEQEAALL